MESKPHSPQLAPIVQDTEPGTYYWCSCGRSASQPFCDGSHRSTAFQPVAVEIDQSKRVAWCACKRSGNGPFCDGSHARG